MTASETAALTGRQRMWSVRPREDAVHLGVAPLIAHLLHTRGITTARDAQDFLDIADSLYLPPSILSNVGSAVERLREARARRQGVAVYGDFDADGVTGTALMVRAFQRFGLWAVPYIPSRNTEGHGLNVPAIDGLAEQGVRVIVTVDCGVTDVDPIAHAKSRGVEVIVTDHHSPGASPPDAAAIVNPKVSHDSAFELLTGVGMALKVSQALLESEGTPDWSDGLLELAAIGTITDLAPLQDENRYIVDRGLRQLRETRNVGLRALMRRAGVDPRHLNSEDIGFRLGPRLNAAGRLGDAMSAYELLMTTNAQRADALAAELEAYNRQRQTLTEEALQAGLEAAEAYGERQLIMVGSSDFNPGIVGLVAGKLAETYGRPAVVYAHMGDRILASCRSVPGFHWAHALQACEGLLWRHGGHSQAAGFSCAPEHLDELRGRLETIAEEQLGGRALAADAIVDAEASPRELMGDTFRFLSKMAPFGVGNPSPLFLARNLEVLTASPMGAEGAHFRLSLRHEGATWDAVAFRQAWAHGARAIDAVYALAVDHWNGSRRLRLDIKDYAVAMGAT